MSKVLIRKQPLPDVEEIRSCFRYDKDTGLVFRVETNAGGNMGTFAQSAVGSITPSGYLMVKHKKFLYCAHRIAWVIHYGCWPEKIIDHINGIRTDNRIGNLREADVRQNSLNSGISARNTSGFKGVSWRNKDQRWIASLRIDGVQKSVGSFKTIQEAVYAIRVAREKHHGEFANHGDYGVH